MWERRLDRLGDLLGKPGSTTADHGVSALRDRRRVSSHQSPCRPADTAHGTIETPVFMPVGTQATVKGVPQHTLLNEIDARSSSANTYHLFLRPGHELIRRLRRAAQVYVVAARDSHGFGRVPGVLARQLAQGDG